jgi:hypothetical protein
MRKNFQMSEVQLERLKDAGKPVPYMVFGGRPPASTQENANRAWESLGRELGFVGHTVEPISGKSELYFSAEAVPPGR